MALTYLTLAAGQCLVFGLSTDTKPAWQTSGGFGFLEMDTGKIFWCDGGSWTETAVGGSGGGGASWGGITGTLANQTDLQSALDAKSGTAHTHTGVYEPANANIQAHVVSAHAPSNAQKNSDITLAEIEAKLVGTISSHTHSGVGSPWTLLVALANDVATGANVTPVNVTGLVFTYEANATYLIEVVGLFSSAAATTGYGLQLDVSSAVTSVGLSFVHQLANGGTLTGGSSIADDVSVGVSSGVPTLNVNVPFMAMGILKTTGNTGTAQLRHRSEVAAVSTIKAGTIMRVTKV